MSKEGVCCVVRELELIKLMSRDPPRRMERVTAFLAHHPEVSGGCLVIVPAWLSTLLS